MGKLGIMQDEIFKNYLEKYIKLEQGILVMNLNILT